jgi:hypothetical protein
MHSHSQTYCIFHHISSCHLHLSILLSSPQSLLSILCPSFTTQTYALTTHHKITRHVFSFTSCHSPYFIIHIRKLIVSFVSLQTACQYPSIISIIHSSSFPTPSVGYIFLTKTRSFDCCPQWSSYFHNYWWYCCLFHWYLVDYVLLCLTSWRQILSINITFFHTKPFRNHYNSHFHLSALTCFFVSHCFLSHRFAKFFSYVHFSLLVSFPQSQSKKRLSFLVLS